MNTSKRIDIEDVLAAVYLAGTTNGLGRDITDPKEIMHRKEAFTKGNPVCKEAKSLIMELISDAEQKTLERSIGLMKDILQENFHYRTMCGEVRDPGGLIDVMQEFVKYQELEPERKQFSEYLEELKAKL